MNYIVSYELYDILSYIVNYINIILYLMNHIESHNIIKGYHKNHIESYNIM